MNVREQIRKNMRGIRLAKKLTQKQIAENVSFSKMEYGRMERGKMDISFERLLEVSRVLNVQITDLIPTI